MDYERTKQGDYCLRGPSSQFAVIDQALDIVTAILNLAGAAENVATIQVFRIALIGTDRESSEPIEVIVRYRNGGAHD